MAEAHSQRWTSNEDSQERVNFQSRKGDIPISYDKFRDVLFALSKTGSLIGERYHGLAKLSRYVCSGVYIDTTDCHQPYDRIVSLSFIEMFSDDVTHIDGLAEKLGLPSTRMAAEVREASSGA